MAQGPAPEECGVSTPTTPPESKCELVDVEGGDVDFKFLLLNFSGPVPVLVMSLLFIASVFMLHIWGKYTRS